ncbi:MAG: PleD family two-component response regulator [Paraglaciecola sp.]|jgi:PleD family two-component response regulator
MTRISTSIEAQEFESEHAKINITLSIVLAFAIPVVNKAVAEFFKVADRNLYSVNNRGRNQVAVDDY